MDNSAFAIHLVTAASKHLLEHVDDDVFDHALDPPMLEKFLACPSNALFVAVEDGCVVGMATGLAYDQPDKPRSLFINEVGVSSRLHRRGIGRQLVAAIITWGKKQGCREAWVATEVGNVSARALYQSTGAKEVEEFAVVYVYPLA
jgi:ribosomal protein S18 acetylase RimI-like enzyme